MRMDSALEYDLSNVHECISDVSNFNHDPGVSCVAASARKAGGSAAAAAAAAAGGIEVVIEQARQQRVSDSVGTSWPLHTPTAAAPSDKPFETTKLNLEAVASTLKDPVIFSQCLLLLLEQAVLSAVTVVLPAAMNTPTWVVGLMYLPLVVAGITAPFGIDILLAQRPSHPTQKLSAMLCCVMFVSCLVVPVAGSLPGLAVVLFVYGATQAAIETLVYLHVAFRLDQLAQHTATHVSMCMYLLAQTAGAGLGNLTGGALQQQSRAVQIAAMSALGGCAALFGIVLGLAGHWGLGQFADMEQCGAAAEDDDAFDSDYVPCSPLRQQSGWVLGQHLHSFTCPAQPASTRLAPITPAVKDQKSFTSPRRAAVSFMMPGRTSTSFSAPSRAGASFSGLSRAPKPQV
eukprot:gene1418-1760_t